MSEPGRIFFVLVAGMYAVPMMGMACITLYNVLTLFYGHSASP